MFVRLVVPLAWMPLVACGFGPTSPSGMSQGGSGSGSQSGGSGGQSAQAGAAGVPHGGSSMIPMGGNGPAAGSPSSGGASGAGGGTPQGGAGGNDAGGSSGNGGSAGAPVDERFKLLWRDDFDTFDDARWVKATHTFDENAARFVTGNAVVEGGFLKLKVTKVASGNKQYSAAEIYSQQDFTFGRFEGRIKFCAGSGMVSSLFTYRDDVEVSWQEIDIEHLGNLPKSIQYNLVSGTLDSRKYQPKVVTFAWSPPAEFHDYAIEWLPDGITFFVDGQQSHHDVAASFQDSAKLRMNAWPTDNQFTSFAGPLDTNAIPCEAQYDWVQVFSYTP